MACTSARTIARATPTRPSPSSLPRNRHFHQESVAPVRTYKQRQGACTRPLETPRIPATGCMLVPPTPAYRRHIGGEVMYRISAPAPGGRCAAQTSRDEQDDDPDIASPPRDALGRKEECITLVVHRFKQKRCRSRRKHRGQLFIGKPEGRE
ncbi:hypothetical protein B0H16DRAFT_1500558 [Mycena metata]|uniref:Uncharacterized protein n=1 Tax=Mycena metata TaxID=1033252 RepID=A0AAD7K624_9AGAR|nr:hypothetical protein B0H16DRAFT_1500558 [Mycena metata]